MRSVRLLGIILQLSRVHSTSVAALSQQFEVSDRTIQRDLTAIAQLGVPIWTRPGPAGGVGIVGGWRSPITGMTGPEIQALMIGAAGSHDLGLTDAYSTARVKMLAASTRADHAKTADERFLNDNEPWFSSTEYPAALLTVAEAVWTSRRLSLWYARHDASPTQRVVHPLGLVLKADRWYLVAEHRQRTVTYRISRITSAQLQENTFERSADFSLTAYWREASASFESSRHTVPVVLSIPEDSTEALTIHVPGANTSAALQQAQAVDGRIAVTLMMESIEIAATQLLAVPGVEVNSPEQLRQELRVRAQEIAQRNA